MLRLLSVVKNDPQSVSSTAVHAADPVTQIGAIVATRTLHGAIAR